MKFGILLEELIYIAGIQKSEFALKIEMPASSLSKVLTGKNLPGIKDKRKFCSNAASILANAIFCQGCYFKFANLFPIIYDFNSRVELEIFLDYALEFAYTCDFEAENGENSEYPDFEKSYLGKKPIMNIVCVILSDYLASNREIPMEIYSNIKIFNRNYTDMFHRIRILGFNSSSNITLNYYMNMKSYQDFDFNILSYTKAQQFSDLNFWEMNKCVDPFFLIKGKFLLLFNIQQDGTPIMTVVTHKGYIGIFLNSFLKNDIQKISYTTNDILEIIENQPELLDEIVGSKIQAAYNFIFVGYLLNKGELDSFACDPKIRAIVSKKLDSIMNNDSVFYFSMETLLNFAHTGQVTLPLMGTIEIEREKRIDFLMRLYQYINEDNSNKIRIVNSEFPRAAVFCYQGFSYIQIMGNDSANGKLHYFKTDKVGNVMANLLADSNIEVMDFTLDFLNNYMEIVSSGLTWI